MDKGLCMFIKYALFSVVLCSMFLVHAGDDAPDNGDHEGKAQQKSGGRRLRENSTDSSSQSMDSQRPRTQAPSFLKKYAPNFVTKAAETVEYYTRCTRSLVLDAIRTGTFFRQYPTPAARTCAATEAVTELDDVIEEKKSDCPLIRQGEIVEFALSPEARKHGLNLPSEKVLEHIQRSKRRRKLLRQREKHLIQRMRTLDQAHEEQLTQLEVDSDVASGGEEETGS